MAKTKISKDSPKIRQNKENENEPEKRVKSEILRVPPLNTTKRPKIDTARLRSSATKHLQINKNNENLQVVITEKSDIPNLRPIVIDGSNIARSHGDQTGSFFSCKGIKIAVDFFKQRGHKWIKVLVPRYRHGQNNDICCPTTNAFILEDLEKNSHLTFTPSRFVQNQLVCSYDDRLIIKAAIFHKAIIVSNDNYRDLMGEDLAWKKYIESNLLQYSFVGDLFLVADDPMGRNGPSIDEFLSDDSDYSRQENSYEIFINKLKTNNQQESTKERSAYPSICAICDKEFPTRHGYKCNIL